MTKYIGKRVVICILLVVIAGFALYMFSMSTYRFEDGLYLRSWKVQWGDTDYFYSPDEESSYFSPLYLIPVEAEHDAPQGYVIEALKISFNDTSPKFYASPFSKEHIVLRSGFSEMLFTLYETEKKVTS